MKIDPERLRSLRKEQKLSLVKLAEKTKRVNPPGITEKTIQRLEAPSQQNTTVREHTVESLTKALNVDVGVLTGELPLPEFDKIPVDNPDRVQIGAQIAPKTRLAYDLIKRRYGVNATEIINMAPLFFVLLAEGSIAWRREKLKKAEKVFSRLWEIDGFWSGGLSGAESYMGDGVSAEEDSIDRADLFGEHLDDDFMSKPFDSSKNNPFTYYLRRLAEELTIPTIVDVDSGVLSIASDFKFPHYDICSEEIDHIANGSPIARICLETGCARLSEIPEELMAEDAGEERAKWLEEKLLDIFREIPEKDKENEFAKFIATSPEGDKMRDIFFKADSQKTNSETEKEGDDQ